MILSVLLALPAAAHPVPAVPVRGIFDAEGRATLRVEVDPRCFWKDATAAPYLKRDELEQMDPGERAALLALARRFIAATVRFHFGPADTQKVDFAYRFEELPEAPPDAAGGTPVVIVAEWTAQLPPDVRSYELEALETGRYSIYFLNEVGGQDQKPNVLFPGERSYHLELARSEDFGRTSDATASGPFTGFLRLGFFHVLPRGFDHVLFVLGLFLLSRKWRPLVLQVSTFTLAHTVTLALSTLGVVHVPAAVVEPLIALSIAVIAIENLVHARYTHWRLLVVGGFGLMHGLGFASALAAQGLPASGLLVGLLGFNVGVEIGQLAVIAAALLVTFFLGEQEHRRYVVVPGSTLIAIVGLWWTLERVMA